MPVQSIFEKITNSIPKPKPADVEALRQLEAPAKAVPGAVSPSATMKDIVAAWQLNPNADNTKLVLQKLQPTIHSAITSFAAGQDKELAVPAANLALETLKSYDPTMGAEPATHVFNGLRRLNRIAGSRGSLMHYAEQKRIDAGRMKRWAKDFEDENGREPSMSEIADQFGVSMKNATALMNMPRETTESAYVAEDTKESLAGFSNVSNDDYLNYIYLSVGPVDQKIIEWTSGFHKKPILSNNEIARKLNISAAAVSQRKAKLQAMMSEVRELV